MLTVLLLVSVATPAPERFSEVASRYSDVALELGTFMRGGATIFTPVAKMRVVPTRRLALEGVLPFALPELPNADGSSAIGNLSLAGLGQVPLKAGILQVGAGVAFPTALRSNDSDATAQRFGAAMLGFFPPYRFGPDTVSVFVPVRFDGIPRQNVYVGVDSLASVLVTIGEDSSFVDESGEVLGTLGAKLRAGYRPGPIDLSVALGATAILGEPFLFEQLRNDIEGQIFVEPGIGLRFGPADVLSGFRLDARLRINLDGPFGGSGLDEGTGELEGLSGVYGLFVELGYRFDLVARGRSSGASGPCKAKGAERSARGGRPGRDRTPVRAFGADAVGRSVEIPPRFAGVEAPS